MSKLRTDRNIMHLLIAWLIAICLPVLLLFISLVSVSAGLALFSVVVLLILGATYMVYRIIYFWGICEDLNTLCMPYEPDAREMSPNWLAVLFLGTLLPFYQKYWWVRQGNRLWYRAKTNYNLELKETGSSYLCWQLLGMVTLSIGSWVGLYKFFENLNSVCAAYNNGYGKKAPSPFKEPVIPRGSVTPPREAKPQTGALVCVNGELMGASVELQDGKEIVVGRDPKFSNVVVQDAHVSGRHCSVRYSSAEDKYYVTDYSANGLFYKDGQRFIKNLTTACQRQTVIVLGKTNNEFLLK